MQDEGVQSGDQQKTSSSKAKKNIDKKGQQDQSARKDKNSQTDDSPMSASAKKEQKTTEQSTGMAQNRVEESPAEQSGEPPDSVTSPVDNIPETAEQRESRLLLQQIPDDPGGLLRRKFLYQYRQRGQQPEMDRSW